MIRRGAEDFVARTNTELTFSFLAVNNSTKKVGLYVVAVPTKQPITGAIKGNWLKSNYAMNYVAINNGDIAGTTLADQEEPTGELTLTFNQDFNLIQENSNGFQRNILEALLMGQSISDGSGNKIAMLGSQGNYKTDTKATRCQLNLEFGHLVAKEWKKLIVDGAFDEDTYEPIKKTNTLIYSKSLTSKGFIMETYSLSGSGKEECCMCAVCMYSDMTADEADTANTTAITLQPFADYYSRPQFLYEGVESDIEVDSVVEELKVDYIVENASDPTDFGVSGDKIAIVNPTTGVVVIKESTGLAWDAYGAGKTFLEYARISATKTTTDTIANAVDGMAYIAIKTPTADLTGTASRFDRDSAGVVENFICRVLAYDRDTNLFAAYVPGTIC